MVQVDFKASVDCSGSFTVPTDLSGHLTQLTSGSGLYFSKAYNGTTYAGIIQPAFKNASTMEIYLTGLQSGTNNIAKLIHTGSDSTSQTPDVQQRNDEIFLNFVKDEYCYYRAGYNAFLNAFVTSLTSETDKSRTYLEITIEYNKRINYLIKLIDFIANTRAAYINGKNSAINLLNQDLQIQQSTMTSQDVLSNTSVLNTRKEMIRYTKEKNNSITNHISLWAALNVVAIAMIFHLYRKI